MEVRSLAMDEVAWRSWPSRAVVAALAVVAGLVLALGPASAAQAGVRSVPGGVDGMSNARYCEVLVLHGLPPTAEVTVWNTLSLNKCPAAKWNRLDAAGLARELGATLVVLNGPRHFLMDSVRGSATARRSFGGMRMGSVAKIKIRSAAELVQRTYVERTITRDNTWTWNRGRRVFELVAPGGDTYVMQSYAQIKDPSLSLAQLPGLGRRLALPLGWRYRTRKLDHRLDLRANGGATILQDELQNTYQLAVRTRSRGPRRAHAVRLVLDQGTVTGTPFGRGRVEMRDTAVRLVFANGSIEGTESSSTITFTFGTGAYRGITSGALPVSVTDGRLTGQGSATW